jgi:hypothetical protein
VQSQRRNSHKLKRFSLLTPDLQDYWPVALIAIAQAAIYCIVLLRYGKAAVVALMHFSNIDA